MLHEAVHDGNGERSDTSPHDDTHPNGTGNGKPLTDKQRHQQLLDEKSGVLDSLTLCKEKLSLYAADPSAIPSERVHAVFKEEYHTSKARLAEIDEELATLRWSDDDPLPGEEPYTNGAAPSETACNDEGIAEDAGTVIQITTDITAVVDAAQQAILALPDGPHLYQRARRLSCIARGVEAPKWLTRAPDTPVIAQIEPPVLRELANKAATWEKFDKRSKNYERALPPDWAISTLYTRLGWKFPLLEGIVCAPTLRMDGAIIETPGYDSGTGLFLDTNGVRFPPIDPDATLDDAVGALAILDEIFADFPFAAPHFQSAALSAVLTLAARHAIDGNTPLFAVRSNTPASGKGLLVDAISIISTGRIAPHWPQVLDEDEDRKRLLTIALSGDACTQAFFQQRYVNSHRNERVLRF